MSDKLDEDKSKYEGFGEKLEEVRKELEQRTNEVVSITGGTRVAREISGRNANSVPCRKFRIKVSLLKIESLKEENLLPLPSSAETQEQVSYTADT